MILTQPGGKLFQFDQSTNINQYAFFAQDTIKFGNLQVQAGLRVDVYHGLVSDTSAQPRIGFSYLIKPTGTVLRASYSRTFETPYNENLILSSATGVGGLASNAFGAESAPLQPGNRNQYNAGLEQAFGRWLVASADYFWKYTNNAYDFGVLFNTPIAFPIRLEQIEVGRRRRAHRNSQPARLPVDHDHGPYAGAILSDRRLAAWSLTETWAGAPFSASTTIRRSNRLPSFVTKGERLARGSRGPGVMTAAWSPARWAAWTMRLDLPARSRRPSAFSCGACVRRSAHPSRTPSVRLRTTAPPGW